MSDEEYEVERIVKAAVQRSKGRKTQWLYFTKWRGYSEDENTWEPQRSFKNAQETLNIFWRDVDTGGRDRDDAKLFKEGEEVFAGRPKLLSPMETRISSEGSKKRGHHASASGAEDDGEASDFRPKKKSVKAESDKEPVASGSGSRKKSKVQEPRGMNKTQTRPSVRVIDSDDEPLRRPVTRNNSTSAGRPKPVRSLRSTTQTPRQERSTLRSNSTAAKNGKDSPRTTSGKQPEIVGSNEPGISQVGANEQDASSPHGSLFSEDEVEALSAVDPDEENGSTRKKKKAAQTNTTSSPSLPVHRARAANPLIKFVDDPLEMPFTGGRISAKARILARVNTGQSEGGGSSTVVGKDSNSNGDPLAEGTSIAQSPSTNTSETATGHSPNQQRGTIGATMSSLLTFAKGKLTTQKVKRVTTVEPLKRIEDQQDSSSPDIADPGDLDDDGYMDIDAPGEPDPQVEIPPTADELLRMAGIDTTGADDLPDFDGDEEQTTSSAEAANALSETAEPTSIFGAASGPLTSAVSGAWRRSTVFGPAYANSSKSTTDYSVHNRAPCDTPNEVSWNGNAEGLKTGPSKSKAGFLLSLDPSTTIPVTLKDVSSSEYGKVLLVDSLLPRSLKGPPGKLYTGDVLNHLKKGAWSARICIEEDATPIQEKYFHQFQDSMKQGKLFITVIGGNVLAICSSNNRTLGERSGINDRLLGLPGTVVVGHVTIEDDCAYANYAMDAEDLVLKPEIGD